MKKTALNKFFQEFLSNKSLFHDKKVMLASYNPETIPHRDKEIEKIAKILAPAVKLEKPSNLFVYGKTGTGKTLTIKYVTNSLKEASSENSGKLKTTYINCKLKRVADTEYRLIAQIARNLGKAIPPTGLPTDEVYKIFYDAIDSKEQILVLILDEIDQLIKKSGDGILYNLTRINEELKKSQICIIGISNDLMLIENLDPRVKSSLSEEELVFPPYNALQIQDILKQRTKKAFIEGTIDNGVIAKCAAYAAREHGDARRALELMRVAGELAEREKCEKLTLKHLDKAEKKIEHDRVLDTIKTQPKQFQVALYSILSINDNSKNFIFTGEIYDLYKKICYRTALTPLTQRRVSDILAEFDMLGIINARVISKGRYGRTREVSLAIPRSTIPTIKRTIEDGLGIAQTI